MSSWLFVTPWPAARQAYLSFTISWSLLKLLSIESVMLSNHLILAACFSCPQSFPASGSFPMRWLFASGGQSIGASASASVLPINSQGWFPLGLTGWISLLSKGLSRVFSSTTVWKHQFFHTYGPTSIRDYWKNHSFDYTDFRIYVSYICIGRQILYCWHHLGSPMNCSKNWQVLVLVWKADKS